MSIPHFKPEAGQVAADTRAHYLADDYMLVVGPDGRIPPALNRTSIDTITLFFTPKEKTLVGLEAYTNAERWQHRPLAPPLFDYEATLRSIEPFDEHGIAAGTSRHVSYYYDQESGTLLIRVGEGPAVSWVRCLANLGCALDVDGQLVELWVLDLELN